MADKVSRVMTRHQLHGLLSSLIAGAVCTGCLMVATGAIAARFSPSTVQLYAEHVTPAHLPVLSEPQAIVLLNQQRSANGIPGDLVEEPKLGAGCLSWASVYREAKGQYPHEELPGQPGYTQEGDEAARSSDLDGEPGSAFTVGALWGPPFNPWSGAALHEASLMDPAVTTAWYGASLGAACMGTGGARDFTAPAFYSDPGPGAQNVPIAQNTGELPWPPQEAVGLGNEPYLAPALLLWDEGSSARLTSATLTTAGGAVPISLVTPETPTPESPSDFPSVSTFGGYTTASFAVPRVKFKKDTSYTLTATWQGPEGTTTQTVPFKTATTDLNGLISEYEATMRPEAAPSVIGTVAPTLHGRRLSITATGKAVGDKVRVQVERCESRRCLPRQVRIPWRRTVTLRAGTTTVTLPRIAKGFRSVLTLYVHGFTESGERVDSQVTGTALG